MDKRWEENRKHEFDEFMLELEEYPESLNDVGKMISKHRMKVVRRRMMKGIMGTAAVIAAAMILVNSNQVVAHALYEVPLIGKIAEWMSFQRGVSSAIEHEYMQNVDLSSTQDDYRLSIPYVISDYRRVVIFFQLKNLVKKEVVPAIVSECSFYEPETRNKIGSYFAEMNSMYQEVCDENPGMFYMNAVWPNQQAPTDMILKVKLRNAPGNQVQELNITGEYEFHLKLVGQKEPAVTVVNRNVEIAAYQFQINELVQYPTGMELLITYPDTAKDNLMFRELNLSMIDDKGEQWKKTSVQLVPRKEDENNQIRYFFDGNYFDDAKISEIQITDVSFEEQSKPEIKIDLKNRTMEPVIEGVTLQTVEHEKDMARITFGLEKENQYCIDSKYRDSNGKEYDIETRTCSEIDGIPSETSIQTIWPEDGIIYLTNEYIRTTKFEPPLCVRLDSTD